MNRFLFFLLISCVFASCRRHVTPVELPMEDPFQMPQVVTRLDIAVKLKEWSMAQPQPFVIYAISDTSYGYFDGGRPVIDGYMRYVGNYRWVAGDSLRIVTSAVGMLGPALTDDELKALYDSITPSLTEEQMSGIVGRLGQKFRMMKYDSLTYELNWKLCEWSYHQFPPKVIFSGSYYFSCDGPNAGGYSAAVFDYTHTQRLQYFTRHLNAASLAAIVNKIDGSLSEAQLKELLLPIAPIQTHITEWCSE